MSSYEKSRSLCANGINLYIDGDLMLCAESSTISNMLHIAHSGLFLQRTSYPQMWFDYNNNRLKIIGVDII